MGIIYGGVYIGQVSRHYMANTHVTRATCALVIYGKIVCICTSYVGLRRKWPYVGEKVPYVRKKETVPFGVPFLCRHMNQARILVGTKQNGDL